MNPNNNVEPSGLSLPAPTFEVKKETVPNEMAKKPSSNVESVKPSVQPNWSASAQSAAPAAPLANPTIQVLAANGAVSATNTPTQAQAPTVANDTDLIEKEWVNKAKHIVEATKEDPHAQNKEINRFKADYIKKRYNKDIKIIDEQ